MVPRDGITRFDYSSVDAIDGDVVRDEIPVYIDHDAEEILVGIDLPYDTEEYETTLDASWREDDASYLPALSDVDDPEAELYRRLPELNALEGDRRDRVTEIATGAMPEYYWVYPSSTSGNHHPTDERGPHGQWIHTKRVLSNFLHNTRSRTEMGLNARGITDRTVQNGIEAVVYHDMFKFGSGESPRDHTDPDHAETAAKYLTQQDTYDIPPAVQWAVHSHNGPEQWDGAPEPHLPLEEMIHTADMTAAASQNRSLLVEPTEELIFADIRSRLQTLDEQHDWEIGDYTVRPSVDAFVRTL